MSEGNEAALARTQAALAAWVLAPDGAAPPEVTSRNGAVPLKRLNIHRATVLSGPIDVLRARYAVVERIVGEAFFIATAREFAAVEPPRSPVLLGYGGGFPAFLALFEPARSLPYLPDVARLEWLRHAAYHAADAEPMAAAALAQVPAEILGTAVWRLHPAVGVVASAYPVLSIWETNALDGEVRRIGPDMAGEAVLVLRPRLDVVLTRLGQGAPEFIDAIASGASLAVAAEQAAARAPEFSLAGTLGACLAGGAFTGFSLEGGSP